MRNRTKDWIFIHRRIETVFLALGKLFQHALPHRFGKLIRNAFCVTKSVRLVKVPPQPVDIFDMARAIEIPDSTEIVVKIVIDDLTEASFKRPLGKEPAATEEVYEVHFMDVVKIIELVCNDLACALLPTTERNWWL